MSKSSKYNEILNEIVNINEDCSEDTPEEDRSELGESEAVNNTIERDMF